MQIFMTGATGFIGRALVARLVRDGHHVRAYVRSPERARALLGPKPSFIVALGGALGGARGHSLPDVPPAERNLLRHAAIRAGVSGADAVVHLAGESIVGLWNERKRERIVAGRSALGHELVEAMRELTERPKSLVVASAVGVYGDRGDEWLDEQSTLGEGFLARVCRQTEAEAERARELGVRVVRLRFGVVLGAGGGLLGKLAPLYRAGLGAVLGSGRQYVSWIALDDAVEALVRSITDVRLRGAVNAVAPMPVPQRELARALGHAFHRPVALRVPGVLLTLGLGSAAALLLESQRVLAGKLTELGFACSRRTLEEALAIRPHSFEDDSLRRQSP